MRVAILDDYQNVALELADWGSLKPRAEVQVFRDHIEDRDALVRRLEPFDCIVAMRERTPFPGPLLERLPSLKLLITAGRYNKSIDVEAATARGVQVCGTEMLPYPTAELTWGLILGLVRHIPREDRATRDGQWQTTLGVGLKGKTLGVIGLGRLGAQVAAVGKAFGMEIIAWSQNLTAERAAGGGAALVDKATLFGRADVVTVHLQLSDRTRGLIGAEDFQRMKPTAYFINTSRGPIADERALAAVLTQRRIAGAAIDVFDTEPLPAEHPFRRLDNIVVTPHLGYVTEENYRLIYPQAVENISAFLDGKVVRGLNELRR
jgi:phosphoglycerate dehydrogenase-like enzyme